MWEFVKEGYSLYKSEKDKDDDADDLGDELDAAERRNRRLAKQATTWKIVGVIVGVLTLIGVAVWVFKR